MTVVPMWPGPAGKLRGATTDTVAMVTAGFTAADWERLDREHLDILAIHCISEVEEIGVGGEDPVAVFCWLYLKSRQVRLAATVRVVA